MRILEPSTNCKLKSKGILVGSTLVDVSDNKPLLIRMVNLSLEPQTIGAERMVALAKPVDKVATLETPKKDSTDPPTNVPSTKETAPEKRLPEPLQKHWNQSCEHLNKEEGSREAALLLKYERAFSLSDSDLGKTNLNQLDNTQDAHHRENKQR